MSYIAFIGYNETDFKDFKIGNKKVSICRKSEYLNPNDFLLRQSQKLGVEGEEIIKNILEEILEEEGFDKYKLIDSHATPHHGDFLMISKQDNIAFMFEVKNKKKISTMEDLNKFTSDIENVRSTYNVMTYGLFLSINSDKITNHKSLEINNDTVYLTRDYISKSTLEIILNQFMKRNKEQVKNKLDSNERVFNYLDILTESYNKQLKYTTRLLRHAKEDTALIQATYDNLQQNLETINNIKNSFKPVEEEEQTTINSLDNNETELEDDDDDFLFSNNRAKNFDAKSCVVKRNKEEDLFNLMNKDNFKLSKITKKELINRYPSYTSYVNLNNIKDIKEKYKKFITSKL